MNFKDNFIDNEIWILSFGGAFQRACIYKKTATEKNREKLRKFLKKSIRHIVIKDYKHSKPKEEVHYKHIHNISNKASAKYGSILLNKRLRIGIVQKLFNLYLKYLWCLNKIAEPPHCPIDSIVSNKLRLEYKFTKSDSIEEYKEAVRKAKLKLGDKVSLSEWELLNFSRRRQEP